MNRKNTKKQTKEILIISEDRKSFLIYLEKILEQNNFKKLKGSKILKSQEISKNFKKITELEEIIITIKYETSDPENIARLAKTNSKKYEKIFCVFDRPCNGDLKRFLTALNLINNCKNIYAITSSPCYEFWLFLHFSNKIGGFKNAEKIEKLNKQDSKKLEEITHTKIHHLIKEIEDDFS